MDNIHNSEFYSKDRLRARALVLRLGKAL